MRPWPATLTDEGIRISSDAADMIYRWPFIRQIVRGKQFVRIELTPLQKVHIPLRGFHDEEHIEHFLREAQSHLQRQAT